MKRILLMIQVVACIFTYANSSKAVEVITEDWPPYNYYQDGEIKGFSTEIVKYIINDLKLDTKVRLLSNARVVRELMTNQNAIYFTMFRTPERENNYKWIGPISQEKLYFYKRKTSDMEINNLNDAKKVKRISARNQGLVYGHLMQNGFENIDTGDSNRSLYLKVINGRNELAIGESELGVRYLLKELGVPEDTLERTDVSLMQYDLYIAASFEVSDDEIARWQASLDKMKASGEYDKIYQKYMQ